MKKIFETTNAKQYTHMVVKKAYSKRSTCKIRAKQMGSFVAIAAIAFTLDWANP